jgi:hypothetical protein
MKTQTTTTEAEGLFVPMGSAAGRRLPCNSAHFRTTTSSISGRTAVSGGSIGRPKTVFDDIQDVGSSSGSWLSVVWSRR